MMFAVIQCAILYVIHTMYKELNYCSLRETHANGLHLLFNHISISDHQNEINDSFRKFSPPQDHDLKNKDDVFDKER